MTACHGQEDVSEPVGLVLGDHMQWPPLNSAPE